MYRVQTTSELQNVESGMRNDYSVLSAEPRMEREVVGSSARSSVNDKVFGPASATRGTTSELRSGEHFDTDTVSNPSDSSKQKARFWFYEPVHPEADTTGVNSRENVSQKLTSTEQDKEEFFVSHKWEGY